MGVLRTLQSHFPEQSVYFVTEDVLQTFSEDVVLKCVALDAGGSVRVLYYRRRALGL